MVGGVVQEMKLELWMSRTATLHGEGDPVGRRGCSAVEMEVETGDELGDILRGDQEGASRLTKASIGQSDGCPNQGGAPIQMILGFGARRAKAAECRQRQ